MSCLLSKFCSIKSSIHTRKLYVPTNNLLKRRTFNQPFRHQKRFQSQTNAILKPTLFCISISSGAIILAAIIQYERLNNNKQILYFKNVYSKITYKQNDGIVTKLKNRWGEFEPSEKIFGTIFLLNGLVFLAWKVPRWNHIMVKYFTTDALSKIIPVSSLLLSAFSHKHIVHLTVNMYTLHSFCRGIIQPRGAMSPEEFTAMYISSCVVSSLASILVRRTIKLQGISLGASGAILSVVGYFTLSQPHEKLSVIFLPMTEFDAIYVLFGIISLDLMGLLLKWHIFDHAAHLGGTLFGMFWYKYMSTYVWDNRRYIVKNWVMLKKKTQEQSRKW